MAGFDGSSTYKYSANRTFIGSILFLDIVEYSKKPVADQIRLKQRFNDLLAESLKDIQTSDRIILDTGDGASVGFLSDPEDALFVALSLQASLKNEQESSMPDLLVRLGINLGPVKIIKDINNQYNLIGDGINIAQRIMSFSDPGQLLVSRSYFDVVSCLSQEYAQLFQYKGARADKHIREHDIYSVEHTGSQSMFAHHHTEKNTGHLSADDEKIAAIPNPVRKTALEEKLASLFGFIIEWTKKNTRLAATVGVIFIVIIALIIFIPKTKYKSSSSKKSARATQSSERNAEAQGESNIDSVNTAPAKAEDISFTITSAKSSGNGTVITIRIRNESNTAKSVALYDDYVKWPKSKIADQSGTLFEVSSVTFSKGSQRITAKAAGTQGFLINPKESVTASMTFKKTGKGIKTLNIHPFIYQGNSWKEHDLAIKISG